MRFGPTDKFWVVVDPTGDSEMVDCLFETTLQGLELQFRGGLTCDKNPMILTDEKEAEIEAYGRMVAARAAQAISSLGPKGGLLAAKRIEVYDEEGRVVFEAEIPEVK